MIFFFFFPDCCPLQGQQPEARFESPLATSRRSLNGFISEPMGGWMNEWVDCKQEGQASSCSESTDASEV